MWLGGGGGGGDLQAQTQRPSSLPQDLAPSLKLTTLLTFNSDCRMGEIRKLNAANFSGRMLVSPEGGGGGGGGVGHSRHTV